MKCSQNTIYLALEKEKNRDLNDRPHTPKAVHLKTIPEKIVNLIVKKRKETGFGKRRLR